MHEECMVMPTLSYQWMNPTRLDFFKHCDRVIILIFNPCEAQRYQTFRGCWALDEVLMSCCLVDLAPALTRIGLIRMGADESVDWSLIFLNKHVGLSQR